MQFTVNPSRVVKVLGGVICILLSFSLIGQYSGHFLGHGRLLGFVPQFNIDTEPNIPTAFSSLLLLSASLLLGVIARLASEKKAPFRRYWAVLALIFAYLSIDEYAMLHETLTGPMRDYLGADGLLYYTWVVPAMGLLALFAVAYARFFWHLPPRWKLLFAASGITYVSGALGCELIGGWYVSQYSAYHFTYDLIVTAEEGLEMAGASLFVYTLLEYLREQNVELNILVEEETETITS